jgi:TPR repeat protein
MTTTLRALLLAAVGAVALAASAVAQTPFQQGLDAFNRDDFANALRIWRPLAEQGDLRSQYFLGALYDFGEGVRESDAEAAKWYRRAAEQGYAPAQYSLGGMYNHGDGVPKNYAEAAKWFRRAAEQGDSSAQNDLGEMYYYGEGVPGNDVEAYKWFALAAARGNTEAIKKLDVMRGEMTPAQIAQGQRLAAEWKPTK